MIILDEEEIIETIRTDDKTGAMLTDLANEITDLLTGEQEQRLLDIMIRLAATQAWMVALITGMKPGQKPSAEQQKRFLELYRRIHEKPLFPPPHLVR